MDRRRFLQNAGLAAFAGPALAAAPAVALTVKHDAITASPAVHWALAELGGRLTVRDDAPFRIAISASSGGPAESFAIRPASGGLAVSAPDARGLVYALLELAQRAGQDRFGIDAPVVEAPANPVRSVARFFVSDVEDKPWYNDRDFWRAYLTTLAAQRFNRFNLTFGIGYDFTRQIRDCYFHFPYPFLMDVKGYQVRAKGLPDDERDHNFEMLKFIAKETAARGLQFHLALWTHAYQWTDSPHANYIIEGLSPETQAPYCRDALARILAEVPEISGLTFRIHGESGVAEGSYGFWKTLFLAAKGSGRTIALDLHAKGINQTMIDTALSTGLPVSVSPKFMAEHMGLPYQQAGIRELEMPPKEQRQGFFALSDGERRFMRYSYGDLFDEHRKYSVMFRIWPGTQRLLLWGDPEFAAAYGKAFQFCGATGVEWCEPLSFKGRKGGGLPGSRTGLIDPPKYDFQKYEYTYKLWGRALYNPATVPPADHACRKGARLRQPHSAPDHQRPRPLRRQQQLLARDVLQHVDRGSEGQESLQRFAAATRLRHGQPLRPRDVRQRGGVCRRQERGEVHAAGSGGVARSTRRRGACRAMLRAAGRPISGSWPDWAGSSRRSSARRWRTDADRTRRRLRSTARRERPGRNSPTQPRMSTARTSPSVTNTSCAATGWIASLRSMKTSPGWRNCPLRPPPRRETFRAIPGIAAMPRRRAFRWALRLKSRFRSKARSPCCATGASIRWNASPRRK